MGVPAPVVPTQNPPVIADVAAQGAPGGPLVNLATGNPAVVPSTQMTPGHPLVTVTTTQDDPRSKQFMCTVTVENRGSMPIDLMRLGASVPRDVTCMEVADPQRARLNALLDEMEYIYKYIITSIPLRPGDGWSGKFLHFFRDARERRTLKKVVRFGFEDVEDAQAGLTSLGGLVDGDRLKVWKGLFAHKLARAQALDQARAAGNSGKDGVLAVIWPNSSFTRKFVFEGERSRVSPRTYCVTCDVAYRPHGATGCDPKAPVYALSQSTEITITPTALMLTFCAMMAAAGGALLQWGTSGGDFDQLVPTLLSAVMLSIIFFNTYEFTSIGKSLNVGVSWRSAMLIGFLCGVGHSKILTAITSLIGGASS